MFIMVCLCPFLFAEESTVPSADDTDRIINESITPDPPVNTAKKKVEKRKKSKYKKTKVKNSKKRGAYGKKKSSL
jgi:flagellar capping protein FliD